MGSACRAAVRYRAGLICVAGSDQSGVAGSPTPDYPMGVSFTGRAWSEATLLRIAYAYEQASLARQMPPDLPPLGGESDN